MGLRHPEMWRWREGRALAIYEFHHRHRLDILRDWVAGHGSPSQNRSHQEYDKWPRVHSVSMPFNGIHVWSMAQPISPLLFLIITKAKKGLRNSASCIGK